MSLLRRKTSATDLANDRPNTLERTQAPSPPVRGAPEPKSVPAGGVAALIVLSLLLVALSAVATYVAVDAKSLAALDARRIDNLTDALAAEVAELAAADQANLALIESELLVLLNRIITVNSTLDAETTARIAKDMILMANVSALDGRLLAAENTLVNATTDIGLLFSILNVTNSSGTAFMQHIEELIANETAARAEKDMMLMANVTNLQSEIEAEAIARAAGDANEAAARATGDATLAQNITDEATARAAKDMILMQNVTNLLANITTLDGAVVKTVNGLSPISSDIVLSVASPGLSLVAPGGNVIVINNTGVTSALAGQGIVVDQTTGAVTVSTTAILTLNGVNPTSPGDLSLVGVSGITINNTMFPNTVTADGSVLVTSITNLQSDVSMHSMEIANLTSVINSQQTTIDNLQAALNMTQMALNGTVISINMTFMQLIMDVMTLQSQVAALQAQLANLTSVAVPTGTIVPWGGTSMNVPAGYLLCDGSSVAIATYMDLYTAIGCKFCAAMTCTMTDFCLPDLRGQIPVGKSETVGSAFNVPPGTSGVGEEKHTLTTSELASHSHGVTDTHQHDTLVDVPLTDDFIPSYWSAAAGATQWTANPLATPGAQCDINPAGTVTQTINARAGNFDTNSATGGNSAGGEVSTGYADNCPNANSQANGIYFRRQYRSYTTSAGQITVNPAGSGTAHNVVQPSVVIAGYAIKT